MAEYKSIDIDLMTNRQITPNWIITDCRFPNEAEAIKKRGGILVRIQRDGIKPINPHISETALDGFSFDYVIKNNGTIPELIEIVTRFIYALNNYSITQ